MRYYKYSLCLDVGKEGTGFRFDLLRMIFLQSIELQLLATLEHCCFAPTWVKSLAVLKLKPIMSGRRLNTTMGQFCVLQEFFKTYFSS